MANDDGWLRCTQTGSWGQTGMETQRKDVKNLLYSSRLLNWTLGLGQVPRGRLLKQGLFTSQMASCHPTNSVKALNCVCQGAPLLTAFHWMVTSDDDFLWHLCQRHRHDELEISLGYPSALRSRILLAQWLPNLPPRRPRLSMRTPPTQAQHISSLKLMQLIVFHSCSTTALRPPM